MAQKGDWEITLTKPAKRTYDRVSLGMRGRFDDCFESLQKNPVYGNNIMPLTGQLKGLIRCRVGDWRVVYRLAKAKKTVEVIAILPRGGAYR